MKDNIELNEEFIKALHLLEKTSRNVFITGKAGTGKSTLLDYFRNTTKRKVVVLAPTGVAAVNVRGETIHSFFRFRSNVNLERIKKIKSKKARSIYCEIDIIIIDEISMVRADLLDCVDKFLKLNGKNSHLPFGGTQMVFIGDLYQLPPVVLSKEKNVFKSYYKSSYFFSAKVIDNFKMEFMELQKIYRQQDKTFIDILNSIRNNTITPQHLKMLNSRVEPDFKMEEGNSSVYLTSTNRLATKINHNRLNGLKSELYVYEGDIEGEFDKKYLPTDYELQIKEGAQVILLNNDAFGRWVNGTIAKIVAIKKEVGGVADTILVKLPGGNIEKINPYKWELFHFEF
ncbi:AAA family ATPase, partial [bacterium]|nr:AAA family ATPase [bacterium]